LDSVGLLDSLFKAASGDLGRPPRIWPHLHRLATPP